MIHSGINLIDGVPVEVIRKRIRCINIRVKADATVCLSVPKWCYPPRRSRAAEGCGYSGATLRQGEDFPREKWKWVKKARAEVLARVCEEGVLWKIRRVKSLCGCCHWRDRYITCNADLARAPRDLVEYVVVHEYTHFDVHNHGPRFYALMDERLPGWQTLRRMLNRREWGETRQDAPEPHPAQTPLTGSLRLGDTCAAPEAGDAPTVAPSAPREPAAPVSQQYAPSGASCRRQTLVGCAKGRKLTFVQTEFRE